MKKQKTYFVISTIIVCALIVSAGIFLSSKSTNSINILVDKGKGIFNLMAHWCQGDVVALIRHAERCDKSDNECLDGDRGITVPGREMALKLGNDFRSLLKLDNTDIYNSPLKRTAQTAQVMFDGSSIDKQWLHDDCKGEILKAIFDSKNEGRNMILITHSNCINNLIESDGGRLMDSGAEDRESYGVTVFFAVDKREKQAYLLGHLFPDDWSKALSHENVRLPN